MHRHANKKKPGESEGAPDAPSVAAESVAGEASGPAAQPAAADQEPSSQPAPTEAAAGGALERELAALKDRHLRLLADFENARKRQAREREEIIRRANEDLLHALLPVLDHLELALASPSIDGESAFVKGIQLVAEQFVSVLHRFDLKPIPAVGQAFDPERHEALTQMPAPGVPAGHVAQQLRRGWSLSGRLLRPAQVVVSSGEPPTESGPADSPV